MIYKCTKKEKFPFKCSAYIPILLPIHVYHQHVDNSTPALYRHLAVPGEYTVECFGPTIHKCYIAENKTATSLPALHLRVGSLRFDVILSIAFSLITKQNKIKCNFKPSNRLRFIITTDQQYSTTFLSLFSHF